MPDEEFQSVLQAAQDGDDVAWRGIVEHYSPPLFAYVRRISTGDPDDALAEVWLSAARTISSFKGSEPAFRSWLFVIAHRRAIDEGRKAAHRPVPTQEIPDHGDPWRTAETGALESVASDEIQALLSHLTPEQRAVVLLRVIGDASLEQTAVALGKRVGAVKALQRRALQSLRDLMSERGVSF